MSEHLTPREHEIIREGRIHEFFEVSILLKGINAAVQIVLGTLFLFFDVSAWISALVENELVEDPDDFLASHLEPLTTHLTSGTQLFTAMYLLSHGIVKIILVAGLLRNKLWAYPASIGVLSLFISYQVIRIAKTGSVLMIALTVFDLFVLWSIWHEYRYMKKKWHIERV